MQAIRKIVSIPANRRVVVDLPRGAAAAKTAEVIVILNDPSKERKRKARQLARCVRDKAFQEDLREIERDFADVDFVGIPT